MWTSFLHLMSRSAAYFPTTLSSNWLSILLPLIVYLVIQTRRIHATGWRSISQHPIDGSAKVLIVIYVLLFCWAIVRTTYHDHTSLVAQNQKLRDELERRRATGISLRVTDLWASLRAQGSLIQIVLVASNNGDPSTLGAWSLQITTSKSTFAGRHVLGIERLPGMPDVSRLDDFFQEPVGIVSERGGYVSFIGTDITTDQINELCSDAAATVIVAATDSSGRQIIATKSIPEMCAVGHIRTKQAVTK